MGRPLAGWQLITTRLLLYACISAIGTSAAIATEVMSSEPGLSEPSQSEPPVRSLLGRVEQQIADDHTIGPTGDNAVETWGRIQALLKNRTALSNSRGALIDFQAAMRIRADVEKTAGRLIPSSHYAVFAELAATLLTSVDAATLPGASPATPDNSQEGTRRSVGVENVQEKGSSVAADPASSETPVETAVTTPRVPATQAKVTVETVANVAPVSAPAVSLPSEASAAVLPSPPSPVPGAAPKALSVTPRLTLADPMASQYASRGDAMMGIKDVSAARRFYEFAANAGDARAAAALARTYEASFLAELGTIGIKPDPGLAMAWYRKAAALGDKNAEGKLQTFSATAPSRDAAR